MEESADESDLRPLAKKLKVDTTGKAIPKVGRASPTKRGRKAALRVGGIMLASKEAALESKVRNGTYPLLFSSHDAKRIEDRYREESDNMAKPTSTQLKMGQKEYRAPSGKDTTKK